MTNELDERNGTVVPPGTALRVYHRFKQQHLGTPTDSSTTRTQDLLKDDEALVTSWSRSFRHDSAPARVPAGLYSEDVERRDIDSAEEGFGSRFHSRWGMREARSHTRARATGQLSKGAGVGSLFPHGFKPFGGEWWRAQRLERLFGWWRDLLETGVWTVGPDGVEGGADLFRDLR